ncbi:MAG: squalene/phytoene synthase family protein, partial [Sphingopyxis sp.]|nr:squalene/phytoene synthase family protein [Sphingopyxis sp.]
MDEAVTSSGGSVPVPHPLYPTNPLILPLVPEAQRPAVQALCALDMRLATLARSGKEPALRQIRLRWWHDQLADLRPHSAPAEPLLQDVAALLLGHVDGPELATLADAWGDECIDEQGADSHSGAVLFTLVARILAAPHQPVVAAGEALRIVERALHFAASDDVMALFERANGQFGNVNMRDLPRPLAAACALAMTIANRRGARSARREQWA